MKSFKRRYRIVKDNYLGYEVQSRMWLLPFWFECNSGTYTTNTHSSIEEAKKFIQNRVNGGIPIMEYNPHLESTDIPKLCDPINNDLLELASWVVEHKRSIFLDSDIPKSSKENILLKLGYSNNMLN
jgi:hypothetical protein